MTRGSDVIIYHGNYHCSLEMLDKVDPPPIPDGYGLSLGFYCLIETVKTIQILIEGDKTEADGAQEKEEKKTETEEHEGEAITHTKKNCLPSN